MNILIPDSWLRDFVKANANPQTIAEKLSLCSLAVEKLHRKGKEVIYEIETTSNRYDTLSVLGIAREVQAVLPRFGIKPEFTPPEITNEIGKAKGKEPLFRVNIADPTLCPRFTAVVLDNIKVKASPKIIQKRLELSGVRPLNNVVDISNYVMLERGQPMHIFDFDKLIGAQGNQELILRESLEDEKIITLDGTEHKLPRGAIVIESNGRLVDLCGIMGGRNSAVDKNTRRVLLFVQIYDPQRIRKTTQALSLRTEASTRFEKGIDPEGVIPALNRGILMLKELASGWVASNLVDINNYPWEPHTVEVELPQIEKILGVRLDEEEVAQILRSLGFEVSIQNAALKIPTIIVTVPSWRDKDINIPEDIIEEVARLYGYFRLPTLIPTGEIPAAPKEKKILWEERAKTFLKHQGFFEVYNYSFTSKAILTKAKIKPENALQLKNPLNKDLAYLRPSLLPTLLQNLAENQYYHHELKFFELERVYLPAEDQKLPRENFRLTGIIRRQESVENNQQLFYITKGIVEGLLAELGLKNLRFHPKSTNSPDAAIHATDTKEPLGTIGYIEPQIQVNFAIEGEVTNFDLDFDLISKIATDAKVFKPLPKQPAVIEDISIIVDEKMLVGPIKEEIESLSRQGIKITTEIIDVYWDTRLQAKNKKSVTLRLYFQAATRTLTETEISKERARICKRLKKNFGAQVRQ